MSKFGRHLNLINSKSDSAYRFRFSSIYIYIYAFSRRFYPKRLTVHSGYTFILSVCVFPGNRTHNFCAANAMLYHWATGTVDRNTIPSFDSIVKNNSQKFRYQTYLFCLFLLNISAEYHEQKSVCYIKTGR